MNFAQTVVIVVFLGILASLGSALVYLIRDRSGSKRTAKALTMRIGMSAVLFALLFLMYWAGLIQPHGI